MMQLTRLCATLATLLVAARAGADGSGLWADPVVKFGIAPETLEGPNMVGHRFEISQACARSSQTRGSKSGQRQSSAAITAAQSQFDILNTRHLPNQKAHWEATLNELASGTERLEDAIASARQHTQVELKKAAVKRELYRAGAEADQKVTQKRFSGQSGCTTCPIPTSS
ncbi:MAG: hypothetical protein CVV16_09665 [Gammaproteobacteria bacterium HGW-Gammaproteobacteria-6]|nr:MAG: hypothetical protein CVV16_09665 [Gammaproteobacteria bacterium HGW-Gammaproteobacteria-6]